VIKDPNGFAMQTRANDKHFWNGSCHPGASKSHEKKKKTSNNQPIFTKGGAKRAGQPVNDKVATKIPFQQNY
jgi:hypothetical protein